ncbi:hypothetical protein Enr13x_59630 [Stieleria neptunia]|uniref:Uncharacterized protein n=1 Tax=Stieleria neptunia TaxID=2527979 RepID=A0A518HYZ0_9BACT|nr:hypothetical protein [Stieleria neptunia]QDV46059.1 hypothetical protein Enr13x_59630 [Stieleria neptunia]
MTIQLRTESPSGNVQLLEVEQFIDVLRNSEDAYWLTGTGEIEASTVDRKNGFLLVKRIPRQMFRLAWSSPKSDGISVRVFRPNQPGLVAVFTGGDYSLEPTSLFAKIGEIESEIRVFANGDWVGTKEGWVNWQDLNFPQQGEPISDLANFDTEIDQ